MSFNCTQPFDQKLGSPLTYLFYLYITIRPKIRVVIDLFIFHLHTTIRPNYMVVYHLFFLLSMTIRLKIRVVIDLFLSFAHDHSTKIYVLLSFILSLCTIIRTKIRVLIDLFLLFRYDHLTIIYDRLSFILFLCTAIQSKIRVLITFFFYLYTATIRPKLGRGHSYSLIHSFLIANILFAIFMTVLSLYFVRSISGSTVFIFRPLYS